MSKDIIDQIVDPEVGLISVDKLYRKLRSEGFARKDIDKAMKNMQTYQVNQSVNPKEYNTIASSFVGDVIQADLIYVFVEKLKSKSMEEVSSAFEKIIGKFAKPIENITTDDGSEFNNVKLKAVMKKHKIKHWITPAYTPNKTIETEPYKIFNREETNKQVRHIVPHMFEVGDVVRRSLKKGIFDKGSTKFSDELYVIEEVNKSSYVLRNMKGNLLTRNYMQYELKKIDPNTLINVDDSFTNETKKVSTKRRLQKKEPAFNDKNTHNVNDEGVVEVTRRHLKPLNAKRVPKKKVIYD